MDAVILNNVSKSYKGKQAVKNVSLMLNKGDIVGVIGANGAGKSTLLEMMMGLRKPSEGKIEVLGKDIVKDGEQIKEKMGVLLQEQCIYPKAKVIEILQFFHDIYKNPLDIGEVIKMVNLQNYLKVSIKNLSGGLKQKVALGIAMINDPDVLFLDEPTTGLDPEARRDLWTSILYFKRNEKTIILSSHYMDEVQRYCDKVIIIKNGQIEKYDTPVNLVQGLGEKMSLEDVYIKYAV